MHYEFTKTGAGETPQYKRGRYSMDSSAATGKQGGIDWTARARDLQPVIAAGADQTEKEGRVIAGVQAALHDAAMFKILLPKSYGGAEASPLEAMLVCEAVAEADASTAWCLGQALGCSFGAAYLAPEIAHKIFGPKDAVLAWGPPSMSAKAIKTEGGYRVTGEWRFGSGARNATWVGGHTPLCDADGTPIKDGNGRPILRTMLFPVSEVELIDVWNVVGLRGTGSDNYKVADQFVADSHTTWRDSDPDRREMGPLYRIPLLTIYGMLFSGLSLGIARTAMEEFKKLAAEKIGGGASTVLRENAVIQSGVAQAEAGILSSRSFLMAMIEEYWGVLCAGDKPSLDQRARLRLSITYAMNQARAAVNFAFQAAGTNAIFEANPFERCLRDIHTLAAQGQSHVANYEPVGQVFLGLQPSGHRV